MSVSTVIVQHRDGTAAAHLCVVLGFAAGMTREVYTDRYGRALVEHSSSGTAVVYVRGRRCETFHAPGKVVVTLG